MAQNKEIKTRIKTVKNIAKVTKTMQMISANRMKRAIKRSAESMPYSTALAEIMRKLGSLKAYDNDLSHEPTEIRNIGIIVIGPSKGFVGSMTSMLTLELLKNIEKLKLKYPTADFLGISIHKLGLKIIKTSGIKDVSHFAKANDQVSAESLVPIFSQVSTMYKNKELDLVYLCYIDFKSATTKNPIFSQLLPVQITETANTVSVSKELFEPSPEIVLDFLLKEYFEKQILNAILSSNASEHSARMLTMKNATDNALGLMQKLTLNYNKGRQAQITEQIIEITAH